MHRSFGLAATALLLGYLSPSAYALAACPIDFFAEICVEKSRSSSTLVAWAEDNGWRVSGKVPEGDHGTIHLGNPGGLSFYVDYRPIEGGAVIVRCGNELQKNRQFAGTSCGSLKENMQDKIPSISILKTEENAVYGDVFTSYSTPMFVQAKQSKLGFDTVISSYRIIFKEGS